MSNLAEIIKHYPIKNFFTPYIDPLNIYKDNNLFKKNLLNLKINNPDTALKILTKDSSIKIAEHFMINTLFNIKYNTKFTRNGLKPEKLNTAVLLLKIYKTKILLPINIDENGVKLLCMLRADKIKSDIMLAPDNGSIKCNKLKLINRVSPKDIIVNLPKYMDVTREFENIVSKIYKKKRINIYSTDKFHDLIIQDGVLSEHYSGNIKISIFNNHYSITYPDKKIMQSKFVKIKRQENKNNDTNELIDAFDKDDKKTQVNFKVLINADYRKELLKQIFHAGKSIYITEYTFALRSDKNTVMNQLAQALVNAKQRGVYIKVRLSISKNSFDAIDKYNFLAYKLFTSYGMDTKLIAEPLLHNKVVIIDKEKVFVGSHNLSYLSLDEENEASFFIKSKLIAKKFLQALFRK